MICVELDPDPINLWVDNSECHNKEKEGVDVTGQLGKMESYRI